MEHTETPAAQVERLMRELPDWSDRPLVIEPAIPVLASPSWRGVDGEPLQVRDREINASVFVKHIYPDTAFYIDIPASFDAASKAGAIGVGPKVLKSAPEAGILIMEDLSRDWRVAGLEAPFTPGFVEKVLEKRKAFSAVAPLQREADVFSDLDRFFSMAREDGATVPADTEWMVDALRLAAEPMRKAPRRHVPIHGDGNISNIMVDKTGEVKLVDFDRAGNGDPLEDIGSFLVEAFAFEPEAREAFSRFMGNSDEPAFNRVRILGVADDLRWGLIGALQSHRSERRTNEFYKYASWRFLRARMAIRDPRFGEYLRRAA
jgi:hypothetical protein